MAKREKYEEFIYQITTLVKQNELYSSYVKSIIEGKNDYKISQIFTKKNYSDDWIDKIEECITALDTIVRNPRKFIVIEEDIVDISLAKSVSVESVKHLAQHTNLISSVKEDGFVVPSKILNTSKEESYEIYENRFIYTLLLKVRDFIDRRYERIKSALMQSGELGVDLSSEFTVDGHQITYNLGSSANIPFEEVVKSKVKGQMSNVERLNRIKNIISDFLNSAFAKEMRSCALVRPPIQRTNVILKDPNFKKALILWQFIESNENMDYKVEAVKEVMELPQPIADKYRSMIFLNTVLLESIAAAKDAGDTLEEAKEKNKEYADEYITKNIDDFVPDDFPQLKLDLNEVRTIYYRIPGAKNLRPVEISKMLAALDRVLRQHRINKLKEDSIIKKKLIAEQKEEEKKAKLIALREAEENERRKKLEEIRAKEEAARLAKEQQEEERRREKERLAVLAEQRRYEEELRKEARRLAKEEADRRAAEEKAKLEEELKIERELAEKRLIEEAKRAAEDIKALCEAYYNQERDFAVKLLTENNISRLTLEQKKTLKKLRIDEKRMLATINAINDIMSKAAKLEHTKEIQRLIDEAATFRPINEIIEIKANIDAGHRNYALLETAKRLEILKAQLSAIKERRKQDDKKRNGK